MANKYANLVGTDKIKDSFGQITTGFDGVDADITAHLADDAPHTGHFDVNGSKTMTGDLVINKATPTVYLDTPGTERVYIIARKAGAQQGRLGFDNTTDEWGVYDASGVLLGKLHHTGNGSLTIGSGSPFLSLDQTDGPYALLNQIWSNVGHIALRRKSDSVDMVDLTFNADGTLKIFGNIVWHAGNSGQFYKGAGSPEGVVTAPVGSIYQRTDGGAGTTLYVKQSGTGNTGWGAK